MFLYGDYPGMMELLAFEDKQLAINCKIYMSIVGYTSDFFSSSLARNVMLHLIHLLVNTHPHCLKKPNESLFHRGLLERQDIRFQR
jgi:hypothetical protein